MVAQIDIRDSDLAVAKYAAPEIDLDSRRVGQEEWGFLVLLGAVALVTLAYVGHCTYSGGDSSISLSFSGVSASCNN